MTDPMTTPPILLSPMSPPAPDHSAVLLDVRAVAAMLDCSERHVYRLADAGKMPPPLRVGALVRWRRSDIDQWITGGCRPFRQLAAQARAR